MPAPPPALAAALAADARRLSRRQTVKNCAASTGAAALTGVCVVLLIGAACAPAVGIFWLVEVWSGSTLVAGIAAALALGATWGGIIGAADFFEGREAA